MAELRPLIKYWLNMLSLLLFKICTNLTYLANYVSNYYYFPNFPT